MAHDNSIYHYTTDGDGSCYLNILHKVLLDILLEVGREEGLLSSGSHLGVGDEEGEHLGNMWHETLEQGQRHGQEQGPRANLDWSFYCGILPS